MASLGNLAITLGVDMTPFNTAMGGIGDRFRQVSSDAQAAWAPLAQAGTSLVGVGASLSAAITAPIAAIGTVSVRAFGEFEGALNRISALGGIVGADLDRLKAQAIDLGAKTQFSALEAAQGMAEFASASFNADQISQAMKGTLDLAAAGQVDVGTDAKLTSDILGQFGLVAADAGRVANTLAAAGSDAKASLSEMGTTLTYFGPQAKQAGMSLEETVAALVALDQAGIRGEKAGTGMRGVLLSLVAPSKDAKNEMAALGLTLADAEGKMLPFTNIIEQLRTKLQDAGGPMERQRILTEIFGRESSNTASILIEKGGPAIDAMTNKITSMGDAADKQAKILNSGMNGALERLSGSVETVGISIGQILAPAVTTLAGLFESAANKVGDFVTWFQQLPKPVQDGALAFTAMAAAIGPILLGVGGIVTAIGTLAPLIEGLAVTVGVGTGALLGWVAVIPLAVAALVALGSWVNDNWEAIRSTVLMAWEGLTDMWAAQWGAVQGVVEPIWNGIVSTARAVFEPMRGFFSTLWDGVEGIFSSVWQAIKASLTSVWEGIKSSAAAVWGGIVSVFQDFLKWAEKIPGVNKLMNLDDAWASAKKLGEETKKTADATANLKRQADAAAGGSGKPIPKYGAAVAAVGKESEKTAGKTEVLHRKNEILEETFRQLEAQHKNNIRELVSWRLRNEEAIKLGPQMIAVPDNLTDALGRLHTEMAKGRDYWKQYSDSMRAEMEKAKVPLKDVEDAFKTLGVNSSRELQSTADKAKVAYETIKNSGVASAKDLDAAWVKYEEARIAAAKAAGQAIPAETTIALDKVKDQLEGKSGKGAWSDWSKQVSTIVTDLGKNISETLWDGDKSWGEKGKAILKDLGESVTRAFVEPATKAIGDLLSGAISDLMGGKGFGGLIDRVKDLGKVVSDIFGGASGSIGSTAGGVGGAAGGASGGAGSAPIPSGGGGGGGASPSGAANVVNSVANIVSAVSDVITAIYSIRQEGTLNGIEHNTRYAMMFLGERGDGGILGRLYDISDTLKYGTIVKVLEHTRDMVIDNFPSFFGELANLNTRMEFAVKRLDQIGNDVMYGSDADQRSVQLLAEIRDAVRERVVPNITVNVSGAGNPDAVGGAVASRLRTQYGFGF